jgi:histidyl-tRNA synthetase
MGPDLYNAAINVATKLRQLGQNVELVLEKNKKSKWVFKHADRLGAKYCAIIGTEEFENEQVAIKNLQDGEQSKISINELSKWVEDTTPVE